MGRGRVKYAIYRDTIESLMRHPEVYEYVRRIRIPLVYSFSLSRVHHVFNALCRDGIPQVGSLYLYDDSDPDGFIVNDSGVYMRELQDSSSTATVRLPSDDEYVEPAIRSSWFDTGVTITRATECGDFEQSLSARLSSVMNKVYVVASKAV